MPWPVFIQFASSWCSLFTRFMAFWPQPINDIRTIYAVHLQLIIAPFCQMFCWIFHVFHVMHWKFSDDIAQDIYSIQNVHRHLNLRNASKPLFVDSAQFMSSTVWHMGHMAHTFMLSWQCSIGKTDHVFWFSWLGTGFNQPIQLIKINEFCNEYLKWKKCVRS